MIASLESSVKKSFKSFTLIEAISFETFFIYFLHQNLDIPKYPTDDVMIYEFLDFDTTTDPLLEAKNLAQRLRRQLIALTKSFEFFNLIS